MKKVTALLMGIFLFGTSHLINSQTALTNSNIHDAVNLWISDQASAQATYGHVSDWDTSNVTNMAGLFFWKSCFTGDISDWDVSNVTDMSYMFAGGYFDRISNPCSVDGFMELAPDITNWDVSSVTTMKGMFKNNYGFNRPIGNWDVSNVTDMSEMFQEAINFNQPIGNWDVSSVTTMKAMFKDYSDLFTDEGEEWVEDEGEGAEFNQDISNWDVSNVTDMSSMFQNCHFNQPIGNWDVSNVTTMHQMFRSSLFNQDISTWDVSSVTDMSSMFRGSDVFNQPIGSWDVSSVTDMSSMFGTWENSFIRTVFNQPIGNWDVGNVTDMYGMFTSSYFNQDISNWDVSNVTNMSFMFGAYWHEDGVPVPSALSTDNYDNLLESWAALPSLQPNIYFNGGISKYCSSESARDYIISTFGWSITDGGLDCSTASVNCLKVVNTDVFLDVSSDIAIVLDNAQTIKGFQFDVTFPDGFSVNPSEVITTGLPENFQVSCSNLSGNIYRVVGFSLSNETIAPGLTSILKFPTFINESTTVNQYIVPITNVLLSDVNNTNIGSPCQADGVVSVYDYPLGDNNGDTMVNILDILGSIDYIFDNPPTTYYFDLGDVNFDDSINILDVLETQDIILNPSRSSVVGNIENNNLDNLTGDNYLMISDDTFTPNSTQNIEINLHNDAIVKGFEFDFTLPEGFTFNPQDLIESSRLDGFNVTAQELTPNTYKILAFSLTASTIAQGNGKIFDIPVFIDSDLSNGNYPVEFTNVIISDLNNLNISTAPPQIGEIVIDTLGIDEFENEFEVFPNPVEFNLNIKSDSECDYILYDLNGRNIFNGKILNGYNIIRTNSLNQGIYILKIYANTKVYAKKIIKQ